MRPARGDRSPGDPRRPGRAWSAFDCARRAISGRACRSGLGAIGNKAGIRITARLRVDPELRDTHRIYELTEQGCRACHRARRSQRRRLRARKWYRHADPRCAEVTARPAGDAAAVVEPVPGLGTDPARCARAGAARAGRFAGLTRCSSPGPGIANRRSLRSLPVVAGPALARRARSTGRSPTSAGRTSTRSRSRPGPCPR